MGLQSSLNPSFLPLALPLGSQGSVRWLAVSICICIDQVLAESLRGQLYRLLSASASWHQQQYRGLVSVNEMGGLWMAFPSISAPFFASVFSLDRNISELKFLRCVGETILKLGAVPIYQWWSLQVVCLFCWVFRLKSSPLGPGSFLLPWSLGLCSIFFHYFMTVQIQDLFKFCCQLLIQAYFSAYLKDSSTYSLMFAIDLFLFIVVMLIEPPHIGVGYDHYLFKQVFGVFHIFFETEFLCLTDLLSWNSLDTTGWPWTHRDPPTSTTIISYKVFFFLLVPSLLPMEMPKH